MPHSDLHSRRKSKNYLTFALLIGLVALFFAVTLIRMGG